MKKRWVIPGVPLLCIVMLAIAVSCGARSKAPVTAEVSLHSGVSESTAAAIERFAPIAYFEAQCARCHGNYGRSYGERFGENLDEKSLFRLVKEMTEGPGEHPLEGAELESLVAYHRSLIDAKPFIFVTAREDDRIVGEVTPGASLRLISAHGEVVRATVEKHNFEIRGSFPGQVELVAEIDGRETRLKAGQPHSHRVP